MPFSYRDFSVQPSSFQADSSASAPVSSHSRGHDIAARVCSHPHPKCAVFRDFSTFFSPLATFGAHPIYQRSHHSTSHKDVHSGIPRHGHSSSASIACLITHSRVYIVATIARRHLTTHHMPHGSVPSEQSLKTRHHQTDQPQLHVLTTVTGHTTALPRLIFGSVVSMKVPNVTRLFLGSVLIIHPR